MGETTKQLIERARAMVANYPLEHGSRGAIDIIAKLVSEIDRLRLTSAEICKARHAADPPQDCDWPFCGCDPAADRVLEAISESGLSLVRTAHTEDAGQP